VLTRGCTLAGIPCHAAAFVGLTLLGSSLGWGAPALACDLCAIYIGTEQRVSRTGLFAGIAEQYTDYGTWQRGGEQVPNTPGERLHSFFTQVVGGYSFTPRIALQVNLPIISRVYRRQEASGIVDGDESGPGDLSLIGSWAAYVGVTENTITRLTLLGGLKLPSGNSHRLKEELQESDEVQSGIHGHDLTLGSGSVDGIVGAQLFTSWGRLFLTGAVQYLLRTEGDFDYEFANDLIWGGGPGEYVLLTHQYTVGIQAELTGESKGNDTLNGMRQTDTAITALYMGPNVLFTWGTSLGANLAVDLPLVQNNSSLQIVPNFRLRGGATWRF
jgi:hypothetical protein